jgi:hypothetical protein
MSIFDRRQQDFYLVMLAIVLLLIPVAALVRWVGWVH